MILIIFVCMLVIFLVSYLFKSFTYIKWGCLLPLSWKVSLYTLHTNPLPNIWYTNIFCLCLLFHFLNGLVWNTKVWCILFYFMDCGCSPTPSVVWEMTSPAWLTWMCRRRSESRWRWRYHSTALDLFLLHFNDRNKFLSNLRHYTFVF